MINEKMNAVLNQQMNAEFDSANLYLEMSATLFYLGFYKFSEYMKTQSEEERGHGLKIFDYLLWQQADINIQAVNNEASQFSTVHDIFASVYAHEKAVTATVYSCMNIAIETNDIASISFLQWFVGEQVQEEQAAFRLMKKTRMVGNDASALFSIENEIFGKNRINTD